MGGLLVLLACLACARPARAQVYGFDLRADPAVIPANGISTTSILVHVENNAAAIVAQPFVHFEATVGQIEPQAILVGGIARVVLRSSTVPGTCVVTAIIGNSKQQVSVEFTDSSLGVARYLQVRASYVAYGTDSGIITASGHCVFDFGETHIESDVRMDVDLYQERLWAEGNAGHVLIRQGRGQRAHELHGDRIFYDTRRRRGIIRRGDTSEGPARQEFMGDDFKAVPAGDADIEPPPLSAKPASGRSLLGPGKAAAPAPTAGGAAASSAGPATAPAAAAPPTATPPGAVPAPGSTNARADAPPNAAALPAGTGVQLQPAALGAGLFGAAAPDDKMVVKAPPLPAPGSGAVTEVALDLQQPNGSAAPVSVKTDAMAQLPPRYGLNDSTQATPSATPTAPGGADNPQNAPSNAAPAVPEHAPQDVPVPDYSPLPDAAGPAPAKFYLSEPQPPRIDYSQGYWIVSQVMRVYPHDKIQFQHTTIFFKGSKVLSFPIYVMSLTGGPFNPFSDMMTVNTAGGLTLNVPYYYDASAHGTGTIFFQHAPSDGFAAEKPGFALALDQQYFLSQEEQGRLTIDQIGHGDWNLDWQNKTQFSPTLVGDLDLDMPEHRDQDLRSTLTKDYAGYQLGLEGTYTNIEGEPENEQGDFYARTRPREIGKSEWTYTVSATLEAVRNYSQSYAVVTPGAPQGGFGLPGQIFSTISYLTRTQPLVGQILSASLTAPSRRLWSGASLVMNLSANVFNYSDDAGKGAAPGWTLGLQQNLGKKASMQLDYTYDRGGLALFGTSYYNFVSGTFMYNPVHKVFTTAYFSKSLTDGSLYDTSEVDYYLNSKWRTGLFADYTQFPSIAPYLDYGWTLGRAIGQRQLTINYDRARGHLYFVIGNYH